MRSYDPAKDPTVTHPVLAQRAIDWWPRYLRHTKGRWAGEPFELLPWQAQIVGRFFGTLRDDGSRQYRTVYLEVPKKQGKSELGAGFACRLLFADGEPGAEIYSAASDREQASIVFNVAAEMIASSSALGKRCKVVASTRRVVHANGGVYRVLSSDAHSKHGYNPHAVIFDELHTQPNRELWDVLTFGAGDARRQPVVLALTTAGYDRQSVCWEVHEYARQVITGAVDDPSFLPIIYGADDQDEWTDPQVWEKANPSLHVTVDIERVRESCALAQQTPALQNTFRRLRLNQWTEQEDRWLDLHAWNDSAGEVFENDLLGEACYSGLDLSSTIDLTAMVHVFPDDEGCYDVLARFWIPEDGIEERTRRDQVPYARFVEDGLVRTTPGSAIDYGFVLADIEADFAQFNMLELAFDRWGAHQISNQLMDLGLNVVEFGQGFASMNSPTQELMRLVLAKRLRHGGNPVLDWQADCMSVKSDPAGNLKPSKPDRRSSSKRIDGMVALIMALDRATRAQGASIYNERGLLSV